MQLNKNDPSTLDKLAKIILEGGTCVLPCDTIYGLSAIMNEGKEKLMALKGRDANKPFLVLATIEQAKELCEDIPKKILDIWPASLTAILKLKDNSTLGIRVPDDKFLQDLLKKVGKPIYSTSVNISGEPSLLDFQSIKDKFGSKVDVLVYSTDVQGTIASTLVDCTTSEFKILRQGSYILK